MMPYKVGMEQKRMLWNSLCAPAQTLKGLGICLALLTLCQACDRVPPRWQKSMRRLRCPCAYQCRLVSGIRLWFPELILHLLWRQMLGPCGLTTHTALNSEGDCLLSHLQPCGLGQVLYLLEAELRENSRHTFDQLNSDCTEGNYGTVIC